MAKKVFKNSGLAVAMICLMAALSCQGAFARDDGRHDEGRHDEGRRGDRYHYRDGGWHRSGWFGFDFAIAALTIGALIDTLPPASNTVVVGGVPYYYSNGYYFRPCPSGYVVVPAPVATAPVPYAVPVQPAAQPGGSVVVNVPNSDGTYTPVTLVKYNNGYIGPQGEFYSGNPTVDQLRTLYGR